MRQQRAGASECRSSRTSRPRRSRSLLARPSLRRRRRHVRRLPFQLPRRSIPAASLVSAATSRKNSRTGLAGAPAQRCAGGNVVHDARGSRDLGAGADLADGRQCPPARRARRNRRVALDPETPDCATMTQWRPMTTLWPICTRLSILAPSPITVSRLAPRSMVMPAPISTSSWMITRPICGTLRWPRAPEREAEAVLADTSARMNDDPIADQGAQRWSSAAPIAQSRPMRTSGPIDRIGADRPCPRRFRRPRPITAPGSTTTPGLEPRRRMDEGAPAKRRSRRRPSPA